MAAPGDEIEDKIHLNIVDNKKLAGFALMQKTRFTPSYTNVK